MGIVEDYKIGNTRIKVADDYYSTRTDEDTKRILQRIVTSAYRHFNAKDEDASDAMANVS